MGGCRCSFRNCESATKTSDSLHFFHYPVKNKDRCALWIKNARKPMFNALPEDQLRNKVVCEYHFEDRCFINEYKKRLVHNAVPTLDMNVTGVELMNSSLDERKKNFEEQTSISVIPTNDDCTNFTLDTGVGTEIVNSDKVETYIYTGNRIVPVTKPKVCGSALTSLYRMKRTVRNEPDLTERERTAAAAASPPPPLLPCNELHVTADHDVVSTTSCDYRERIKKHARDIEQLKKTLRTNRLLANAKRMKAASDLRRRLTKAQILRALKPHLSSTAMAIVNIDIFKKTVNFTGVESKFLIDLYKASPQVYIKLQQIGWSFLPNVTVVKEMIKK